MPHHHQEKPAPTEAPATDLVPPAVIAGEFGIPVRTLENWRQSGKGPPFFKANKRVFYSRAAVQAWVTARVFQSTAEARKAR